jgi:hypothetical protein
MNKRKDDALCFDDDGKVDRELTALSRNSDEQTQYDAPKDRKWKARNLVTIHWNLLNYPCPYPSMVHIFACLIDHANIDKGRCDASQKVMAIETGYNWKTVKRALDWLAVKTPFLKIERRIGTKGRFSSNAYHIQWANLEADWAGVQTLIQEAKVNHRARLELNPPSPIKGGHGQHPSRGVMDRHPSRGVTNHEGFNHEERNHDPERVGPRPTPAKREGRLMSLLKASSCLTPQRGLQERARMEKRRVATWK